MEANSKRLLESLPAWTWFVPATILALASVLSVAFSLKNGPMLFYLPIPLGIVLIHWWGPRILPAIYLQSLLSAFFWEWTHIAYWPVLALHEVAVASSSWLLFSKLFKGRYWIPNIKNTMAFLTLGILIPVTINSVFVFAFSPTEHIWNHLLMIWTADLACSIAVALPALYFLTPALARRRLVLQSHAIEKATANISAASDAKKIEVTFSIITLLVLSFTLPIEKYWFLFGIFTTYVSLRFGYGSTLFANLAIFIFTYIGPFVLGVQDAAWPTSSELINVHLGMCMLSITACVTGRVVTDLRNTERILHAQFRAFERTNKELDRFVYSVSHDLSAPLKSLLGLIQISRIEKDSSRHIEYINKMESSILKLEGFIKEILDFSRNSRLQVQRQTVPLRELITEVLDNLKFLDNFNSLEIRYHELQVPAITTDRVRLKIILTNLLSNAIKYQRSHFHTAKPVIWINTEMNHRFVKLKVKDNGQGIADDHKPRIFEMFYRGTEASTGSGLGLYIAREAAETLAGKIEFESTYGEGSEFIVYLPK